MVFSVKIVWIFGTRVLLKTLCDRNELGEHILDVGCGYGVIGITLKKIYPKAQMEMVDVNPRAVLLAKENAQRNNVDVYAHESNIYEQVDGKDYTDILTNPPIRAGKKCYFIKFFEEAYERLCKDGSLWVVIRKQQGANSAVKK